VSARPQTELTWTKAIFLGFVVTAALLLLLVWIPSHFTYYIWDRFNASALPFGLGLDLAAFYQNLAGREMDPYTLVRIRDAVSLGYQSTVFAVIIVATYIWGERRRRRLGQRGPDEPRDYLPGK
jgi:hypothetical protein